jgi:hypothetical protein
VLLPDSSWPQAQPPHVQQAAAGGRAASGVRVAQAHQGGHAPRIERQQQAAAAAQPCHDDGAAALDDALSGSTHDGRRHPAAAASQEGASHSSSQNGAAGTRRDAGGDATAHLQRGLPLDLRSSGRRTVTSMMRLPGALWCSVCAWCGCVQGSAACQLNRHAQQRPTLLLWVLRCTRRRAPSLQAHTRLLQQRQGGAAGHRGGRYAARQPHVSAVVRC